MVNHQEFSSPYDEAARSLERRIPGLAIESCGGAIPFQAWGTLQTRPFYFRYRSGSVSLKVGQEGGDGDEFDLMNDVEYLSTMDYGDIYDGSLSKGEFELLMVSLVANLKPSPYYYSFQGIDVKWVGGGTTGAPLDVEATTEPRVWHAWGHSAEEAYEKLWQPSEYLLSHGFSRELQRKGFELSQIDPKPATEDPRAYPDPPHRFEVHD